MSAPDLVKYDAACAALAEAARVDEVRRIRNQARALEVYAKQANDTTLFNLSTEIRLRAERKAGALLARMATDGERATRGGDRKSKSQGAILTLADIGVTPTQSSRWQELARVPDGEFEVLVAQRKSEALKATQGSRAERQAEKKRRRAENERALAAKVRALPEEKFVVVYADPEWKRATWSGAGMDRAAENHYPTTETADICARDVASIAADDSILFLWATQDMLPEALDVMRAWGFKYVSRCVWDKESLGMGYWFRDACEILLVGVRGNVPCPAPGENWPSLIRAKKTQHSAKPLIFRDMIEAYFPTVPKIVLNHRGPAWPGWRAWGNEAEEGEE